HLNEIKEEHILVMYNMCSSLFLGIFNNLGLDKIFFTNGFFN
ncbi:hypothetical protein HNR53_000650, partial [Bacillus benzoevorans]|nr:hypothetical protein [Bacillus benzoevorans]